MRISTIRKQRKLLGNSINKKNSAASAFAEKGVNLSKDKVF